MLAFSRAVAFRHILYATLPRPIMALFRLSGYFTVHVGCSVATERVLLEVPCGLLGETFFLKAAADLADQDLGQERAGRPPNHGDHYIVFTFCVSDDRQVSQDRDRPLMGLQAEKPVRVRSFGS